MTGHKPPFFTTERRQRQEQGNWALSFADMMTLLLCFFVLMVTVSKVDPARYQTMSSIMSEAMKGKAAPAETAKDPAGEKRKNLFALQKELSRSIGQETEALSLKLRPDAVAINLKGAVFFKLGDATLTGRAKTILDRIVGPLTEQQYELVIEGHSDNIPIHSDKYPSNWELSSARASSVARFFIARGFPKDDIKVMGLADTRPIAPNTDGAGAPLPDNQSRNRRVIILVKPGATP
ncbi:OmpA/MotB family protein [Salidesulfovibrio onnuriiensis]|uniref:OmpA/MotB family protein n=1 Tax=Salidesulfovibrio onnuriiensis TaxID=2583823 RepID=UPI0011C75F9A|nr:OmpA family protein [Salidesulfovibrio onnuriiensis]